MITYNRIILFLGFLLLFVTASAQDDEKDFDSNAEISGQWFMAYHMDIPSQNENNFGLKRGYLTVKKKLSPIFSVRYTQDITLDKEGDDAGNVELRFKYCYLKADLPEFSFFKEPFIEVGLVHQPWIEFEQKINTYRVQGQMFLEKYGVTSSADFGFNTVALLGGKLDDEARKKVDSSLPGKYGSVSFGVYNGGGYHAPEVNNNKTVEGRLTLRPFPSFSPGLQFSYGFATGQGNDTLGSKFNYHAFMVSHETAKTTLTAQYYHGVGFHGSGGEGMNYGASFFGEICIPFTPLTIFGRYDSFRENIPIAYTGIPYSGNETYTDTFIGGIAWKFYKNNRILIDIEKERVIAPQPPESSYLGVISDDMFAELALEIVF